MLRDKGVDILVDRVTRLDKVEPLQHYETLAVVGKQQVESLRLRSRQDQSEREIDINGVFVEIDLLPDSSFALDVLKTNDSGETLVDCQTQTGVPGVFAAGDVTNVHDKQVIIAAGEGAKAALRANEYLLAGR